MYVIYRIEHETSGLGPHHHSDVSHNYLFRHNLNRAKYPNRRDDLSSLDLDEEKLNKLFAACPSYKLLMSWFTPREQAALKKKGFILRKLRVRRIIMGESGRQCFFKKSSIIHI